MSKPNLRNQSFKDPGNEMLPTFEHPATYESYSNINDDNNNNIAMTPNSNNISTTTHSKNTNGNKQSSLSFVPTTSQQKRQNSNSFMSGSIKRSVTNNSSSFLTTSITTPVHTNPQQQHQPLESNRATQGTLTPSLPLNNQQQSNQYTPQPFGQQHIISPFKSTTFNISSPIPQFPAKGKKFSTTFVNSTYQKNRPELPHSPSLSVNRPKYDTSSFLNDDRTEVNDFNDLTSVSYSQTIPQPPSTLLPQSAPQIQHPLSQTIKPLQQATHASSTFQASLQSSCSQPQQLKPQQMLISKEISAESPGSTISETSNVTVPPPISSNTSTPNTSSTQTKLSEEEQALIIKLQDTYKTIISLETDLQKKCSNLNLPQRLDMTELWDIYNVNITLLNSYYDFLLYSLSSGKSGKQIVQVYRIPRRLWVYGIVTFLDVLKNVVSIFVEHDICSSFIAYSFNILSGLVDLEMEGWLSEKLGDLSRMAIALYPSRFIDWKLSAEYWYSNAMKTQYGFGKIYYHIATVQQDNLDALMNIGKSVFCRDTFVPTPQYMRMVIDNINQRNFVDLPVVDFIKVHKILLSGEFSTDLELIKLVSYYSQNIGIDNNKVDFFVRTPNVIYEDVISPGYTQETDYENKLNFWFQRSSSFALVNICQVVGFGNSSNPFARLFGLLEALKERKDRKDKKEKRKKNSNKSGSATSNDFDDNNEDEEKTEVKDFSLDEWFRSTDSLNKNAIELSMRMFANYLNGPIIASTPHVITYLYFLIAIGEAIKTRPTAKPFFELVLHSILPINSLIGYLNELLNHVRNNKPQVLEQIKRFTNNTEKLSKEGVLKYFNSNETLVEVWKCWGTLWFDCIELKEEYFSSKDAGLANDDFLDVPIGGVRYDKTLNRDRYSRILLLATFIADEYNFGIKRGMDSFAYYFDEPIIRSEFVRSVFPSFTRDTRIQGLSENVSHDKIFQQRPTTSNLWSWYNMASLHSPMSSDMHSSTNNGAYLADADDEEDFPEEFGNDVEDFTNSIMKFERDTAVNHFEDINSSDTKFAGSHNIGIGMDSSFTYFILDTNMLLKHCGKIFKSVRNSILKIAIPLIVFQELRSLRRSPDANVSDAATRGVITVRQLYIEGRVLPLRLNATVASSINEIEELENNTSWMKNVDESILNCSRLFNLRCNSEHKMNMAKNGNTNQLMSLENLVFAVLITDDRNLRLRARSKNIPSFQSKWLIQVLDKLSNGRCSD